MKKWKKVATLSVVGLLAASALAACGGSKDSGKKDDGKTDASGGGVLNVSVDVEIASLDPQIAVDGTSFEVIADFTDGLYTLDKDGNAIEALVDKVDKSEDGLNYTFTLKDAKWSNGDKVTADDFVFAWRRAVDPKVASEYNFIIGVAGVKNVQDIIDGKKKPEELGVKASDEKTLEVSLDTPVPFFESLMSFPTFYPVNQKFFEEQGDNYGTSPETVLSNGAFKLKSYEPAATTVELEKNADYYDADKIKLDGLKYQIVKDSQQAVLSYESGDLDVVTLSGEQVDKYKDDKAFVNIMEGYLWFISPNTKVAGLENLNMRMALALSFDKESIVNNVLKDGSIPANFLVPTKLATGPDGKDFVEDTGEFLKTDKEAAKKYFAKAKKELGKDSFSYTLMVEDTESAVNVAQVLKSQIEETLPGFKLNIEQMPKKTRVERMQANDYEVVLTRWGPDYADPMTYLDMWITGSNNNYGQWSNKEYDAIIADCSKGKLATDPSARWEALVKAHKIAADEAVIAPVYQKGAAVLVRESVKGIEFHPLALNRVYKNTTKE